MKRSQWITLAVLAPLVAIGALLVARFAGGDDTPDRPTISAADDDLVADHEFVIPLGTGDRIDNGELVEIVPAELVVDVGDVLRIVNQDDRGHAVGAFYVARGETLTQTFQSPGELSGDCSIHPSGSFTLTVRA
jgi:hypothetical protein